MRGNYKHNVLAFSLRTVAAFIVLYQIRLIAGELANTTFFVASFVIATLLGLSLGFLRFRSLPAIFLIAIIPWIIRAGLSTNIGLSADIRILSFDRNLFVALLPFYWAGTSAYFSVCSEVFIKYEQLSNAAALAILFAIVPSGSIRQYEQPIVLVTVFAFFGFVQLLTLAAEKKKKGPSKRNRASTALIAALICLSAAAFLIRPFEEGAVDQGGGLIKPNLFRFDFSQFLRLESEISLNDDLVLIVRKDAEDQHIFIRRFVLSGYDKKRGFYRDPQEDEKAQNERLPDEPTTFSNQSLKETKKTKQEYFLVNFDPSAFIALNKPLNITPFTSWDASSFTSAYAVESETSEALPFELIDAVPVRYDAKTLGLNDIEYKHYTEYGADQRIEELAHQMTGGVEGYWDKVQTIYEQLKYGDFRYSLKPGIAADGDQLGRFLFETKKGYCSYFAFSMTVLLRSLGIPSRVAVGFFIDPDSGAFNYYPVRSDMAHAWVEVYFPQYGWIEYDPTTENLAEGEEFRFSSGVSPDLFERLMREILENRDRLTAKMKQTQTGIPRLSRVTDAAALFFHKFWTLLIVLIWIFGALAMRVGLYIWSLLAVKPRNRARLTAKHTFLRLALAGHRPRKGETLGTFTSRIDEQYDLAAGAVIDAFARARFAPEYNKNDGIKMSIAYRNFSQKYRRNIHPLRSILAWIIPPLAAVLPPTPLTRKGPLHRTSFFLFVLFLSFFAFFSQDSIGAQETSAPADVIYDEATEAVTAERWDRAVELYRRGESNYPNDVRFSLALGDLYTERSLYRLAWEEYKKAEAIEPDDAALLYKLANTAGRLNEDQISATYLERVVDLRPEDRDAIGDLGWMYFKLHRLQEGEHFLLDAIDRLGPDRGFSMTLGTIYSDLFEYKLSKERYMEAITDAQGTGAKTFEAVAQYNLSILESRHHHYAQAFDRTGNSLAAADRASGHLARGELYLKRLDFRKTFSEYQVAYSQDLSPLSKINIANAYRIAGRLEEARVYAEETLSARDLSWMLNYGTDIDQHRRDLHEILSDVYAGLVETEKTTPRASMGDAIIGFFRSLLYRVKASEHRALFCLYSYRVARAYDSEGQRLDALVNYYNAFQRYPSRAIRYLSEARTFESSIIPKAAPSYDLEEGSLQKDRALLEKAIASLDPIWERDLLAEAWTEYALIAQKNKTQNLIDATERLFALNRGALRQRGIRLPLTVKVQTPSQNPAIQKKLVRAVEKTIADSGFIILNKKNLDARVKNRFQLSIVLSEDDATCELTDYTRGIVVVRKVLPLPSRSRKDLAVFGRLLANAVYSVE